MEASGERKTAIIVNVNQWVDSSEIYRSEVDCKLATTDGKPIRYPLAKKLIVRENYKQAKKSRL
jgi:hypothetical protein